MWVLGRAHWTVSLYGANVHVEIVMVSLETPAVSEVVTGKSILSVSDDADNCK